MTESEKQLRDDIAFFIKMARENGRNARQMRREHPKDRFYLYLRGSARAMAIAAGHLKRALRMGVYS